MRKSYRTSRRKARGKAIQICIVCIAFVMTLGVVGIYTIKSVHSEQKVTNVAKNGQQKQIKNTDIIDKNKWYLRLVNKWHPMKKEITVLLEKVEGKYEVDKRIVTQTQQMLSDARAEGMNLVICSAYRPMEYQRRLYTDKVQECLQQGDTERQAEREAAKEVAVPGESEHALGLSLDIVSQDYQLLDKQQENTKESQWLHENCHKYGFILRYPTEKTSLTGIIYEPWHYRYVGEKAATDIYKRGICLEEYLNENNDKYSKKQKISQ